MIRSSTRWLPVGALLVLFTGIGPALVAQTSPSPATSDLGGVYQAIPSTATIGGSLKNSGSPSEISLLPAVLDQMKSVDLTQDPEKMCQPIGPFRMMARERTKIELVPALARGMIVMLFEDVSHGYIRTIFLNRGHTEGAAPTWQGESVGRWEGGTLVVDTTGFNERTWLNEAGAPHSDALHLVERIRPVLGGKYLEYKVTAEDPKVLTKPYSYTRYFEKLDGDIMDDVCED